MQLSHEHPIEDPQRLLKIGIFLTFLIFVVEFVGGFWTRSLALLSDAWHVFIDIWALTLSLFAIYMARRPVNDRKTFGLHRLEVLAAAINGLSVFVIAVGILWSAWKRFQQPVEVRVVPLLWISLAGLLVNLIVAALFYRRSRSDLNIRGAFMHVVSDALNSVAVLIAAGLILVTKKPIFDPIVSVIIASVVLWGSGRLLKESLNTLLEGVPPGIRVGQVEKAILEIPGIESVHDLHVWSICSHLNTLSGHVLLAQAQMEQQPVILDEISRRLKDRFGILHTTIQVESRAWPTTVQEFGRAQNA
jgi:cobalt-zinc-cadmium efflux system protein